MIQNRTAYLDSLDISNLGVCSKNLICLKPDKGFPTTFLDSGSHHRLITTV